MYDYFDAPERVEDSEEPKELDPSKLDAEVAERSLQFALSMLNKVSDKRGNVLPGVDLKEGERVLTAARGVIDRANKARRELQDHHQMMSLESAVIEAARQLPPEYSEMFLQKLDDLLHLRASLAKAAA
jgi:hypothetical protein